MPLIEDRLRVLAVGIRPTFATACGMEAPATVDVLDASGIAAWQIGIRELADTAGDDPARDSPLRRWARAELEADARRWKYLEAFVEPLVGATARPSTYAYAYSGSDSDWEVATFWHGWVRNMSYALDILVSIGLVVSPDAVSGLEKVTWRLSTGPVIADLPGVLARLAQEAKAHVDAGAARPPQLVLPEHRAVLTAALSTPPRPRHPHGHRG
jgi:hypothetical protein